MNEKRFSTALRDYVREKIERLGHADIVVGIPSYLSDNSILHVLKTISKGLERYYHDAKALVIVSDGGSTDDTREIARSYDQKSFNIEKIVTIYRGIPGKGSALRAVFEAAKFLKPWAVAIFDSDLASISMKWIQNIIDPIKNDYDLVCPDYNRYKLDATITNTMAYNLTRALYGVSIRQPIGGDFGFSFPLIRHLLNKEDEWESDVARFGVDIWLTTTAIVDGFNICQAKLGTKVHGQKDPAADLGPMFRQVVGTIFRLMEIHENFWKEVRGSREVPTIGDYMDEKPVPFDIDQERLIEYFRVGFKNFGTVWQQIVETEDWNVIQQLADKPARKSFYVPIETWVRIVYRYANAFHTSLHQRMKLLDTMIPLYYGRVASLVNELDGCNTDNADELFIAQAKTFEDMKGYLLDNWH